MDYQSWNVDIDKLTAVHSTGFMIVVEGNPRHPTGVTPGSFPAHLSAIEQVRLLRCGLEAIAQAAPARSKYTERKQVAAQVAAHKPKRPVLSLKRRPVDA